MRRRIVIELDIEEDEIGMIKEITHLVMDKIDNDVEFTISQEFIPDKELHIPTIPTFMGKKREA